MNEKIKNILEVKNQQTLEENPSRFQQLADRFKEALSNPETVINLIQGLGAVPGAVATVQSIMTGSVPVAIGSVLVTAASVLGGMLTQDKNVEEDMVMA